MKIAQHIIISFLVLLVAIGGHIYHFRLMWHSMMHIKNTSFISYGFEPYGNPLFFTGALISVLLLYFILNRLIKIPNIIFALLFLIITYLFGVFFWWIRLQYLKGISENYPIKSGIRNSIAVNSFQFEFYFMLGIVIGFLICLVLFPFLFRKIKSLGKSKQTNELIDN